MIITIDEKWRLVSDRYCWAVQERAGVRKDGTPRWKPVLYYTRLEQALRGLADLNMRLSEADGLVGALDEAERFSSTLRQALSPLDWDKVSLPQ